MSDDTQQTTAVSIREIHQEGVTEILEVKKALVEFRDKAHLLTPFARTDWNDDSFPPFHKVSRRFAVISSNKDDGEVYEPEQAKGKLALTKIGLQKLEQLAGIKWTKSVVIWDSKNPLVARGEAAAQVQDLDGSWRNFMDGRTIDLNDGSLEAEKMRKISVNMLEGARKNIIGLAETKAKNRVRRGILGLQASFTKEELQKPFVVFKLVKNVERILASNPILQTAMAMQELNISSDLYRQAALTMGRQTIDMATGELMPGGQDQIGAGMPPVAPPIDTSGLQVQDVPATVISDTTVIDPEEAARQENKKHIEKIEALYQKKLGKGRDDRKPPLTSLTEDELDEVEEFLTKVKDHEPKKA